MLRIIVNLHGFERWLHGEALDALDVNILLALFRSDSLFLALSTTTTTALPHLGGMDLSCDLLCCVLGWFCLSSHVV
jgi:hypothetical protein